MPALLSDQFVDHLRNKPFEAFGAVVGGDMEVFGHGAHRVGVNEHVAGLGADDHVGLDAVFLEPFDLRIDRSGAHAACEEEVMPLAEFVERHFDEFGGVAERACEVGERFARFERTDFARRSADGLRYDGDAALFGVEVGDRERNAFAVFIGAFIVALMAVDALWNVQLQQQQAENEAREKAEVLADEMHAMWDFIDINQNTINRTEDGAFRTKALVCVVTAKSVSTLFTMNTDYKINYTSPTPRQAANAPDEFEQRAFEAFGADAALEAYYDVGYDAEGRRVFRYAEPLYVTETCLECHGEPAGEVDITGKVKEGWTLDSEGGAISIVIPLDQQQQAVRDNVVRDVVPGDSHILVAVTLPIA